MLERFTEEDVLNVLKVESALKGDRIKDIARYCGVSYSHMAKIYKGQRRLTPKIATAWAKRHKAEIKYIYEGKDD